ncbi:MAG TPA: hypothetical protein VI916_13280 [Acidimicrobiia bacterium]|nr:hypothetical protein [Acidimicrobiia bacterium]
MRKLGIVIALTAAATLGSFGFAGTASAQSLRDLPAGGNEICDGAAGFEGQAGPFEPVRAGFEDNACNAGGGGGANPLCDVLVALPAELAPVTGPVGGQAGCATTPPPPPAPPAGPSNNPPAAGGGSTVQGANAAADGSLPRTGGELFAGAGFALMSLGALVRRYLP